MKNIKVHLPVILKNGVDNGRTLEQIDAEIALHTTPKLVTEETSSVHSDENHEEEEKPPKVPKTSFRQKWKTDKIYRAKFIHTLCLFWSFVNLVSIYRN